MLPSGFLKSRKRTSTAAALAVVQVHAVAVELVVVDRRRWGAVTWMPTSVTAAVGESAVELLA